MTDALVPPVKVLSTLAAPALALVTSANFFWTYAFNDDVGSDDHRAFLLRLLATLAVLGVMFGLVLAAESPGRPTRTIAGTFAVLAAFACGVGAAYALALVVPQLDSAIGTEVSDTRAAVAGVGLAATSAASFLSGRRLLRPTTPSEDVTRRTDRSELLGSEAIGVPTETVH